MGRITGWSTMSSAELWTAWCALFPSVPQAEAHAIWVANRLVKEAARSTRLRFYEVKDAWLARVQGCLVEGRKTRVERRYCRACNPLEIDPDTCDWHASEDDWCARCDGTGIWSERTLWLHLLDIEGIRFAFHSYVQPAHVCDLPGEDQKMYGGTFSEDEWAALHLPVSGLVRMLRWVMMALWHDQGQPVPLPTPVQQFGCHCLNWPGRRPGQHHEYCQKGQAQGKDAHADRR